MGFVYSGVFIISMATLMLEISLIKIMAVSEWYHFAFMIISVALFGFGASGSFLSIFRGILQRNLEKVLTLFSGLFAVFSLLGYLAINKVPFDSFRIGWEADQYLYLGIYYLSLAIPFFFSGLCCGFVIARSPALVNKLYFSNLAGSGVGCLAVMGTLAMWGGPGSVVFCFALGLIAALSFGWRSLRYRAGFLLIPLLLAGYLLYHLPPCFEIQISPYKSLSTILKYPGARLVFTKWNAFSRIDIIESYSIKYAPGLSYTYNKAIPPQLGMTIDGDNLRPITCQSPKRADTGFTEFLPAYLAYQLKDNPDVLLIELGGGLGVLTALNRGARSILVLESNPLVWEAVKEKFAEFGGDIYSQPDVNLIVEGGRNFLRRSSEKFDIIELSLVDSFKPVGAETYSLTENYLYTREAFQDFYEGLAEDGILVLTRWLQLPPSESIRLASLVVEGLADLGIANPQDRFMAYRSWSTSTLLVKRGHFTHTEIKKLKDFCAKRKFDLIYFPGIVPDDANRFQVFEEPYYYQAFAKLFIPAERESLYRESVYNLTPTTDDKPFFFHFFKWSQLGSIIRGMGKRWQPFAGGGYLVLGALFLFALGLSIIFIILPLYFFRRAGIARPGRGRTFIYFFFLGLGYLGIEIPLMQKFIFFLGQPVYAFCVVLFAILVFSGLGSLLSERLPISEGLPWVILALSILVVIYIFGLPHLFRAFLGLNLFLRMAASVVLLAPLGLLMGVPFPAGIRLMGRDVPDMIAWAWGINGCASVLSSILACMVALQFGFSWVLGSAAAVYLLAFLAIRPFLITDLRSRFNAGGLEGFDLSNP